MVMLNLILDQLRLLNLIVQPLEDIMENLDQEEKLLPRMGNILIYAY